MSRHRNVRTMNYDEYDDDDDYPYGHSVEDECISPTDAQQWIFDRARGQHSMSSFLANNRDIEEEDDSELVETEQASVDRAKGTLVRRDSECYQLPELNDEDRVRLMSCMDEIRNIVGESLSDRQLVEAIMKHNYNFDNALDELLNSNKSPPLTEAAKKITVADIQEPIEKDFKTHEVSSPSCLKTLTPKTQGTSRFMLPIARFGSNVVPIVPNNMKSGVNLTDLVKSRMKKHEPEDGSDEDNSEDGEGNQASLLPKLSDLSINTDSGIASSSPADSMFSNLTDLARHHLQSKGETPIGSPLTSKSGGFVLPNIFNKPASGPPTGFVPNPKSQTPLGKKEWIVDLKSALIKDKSEITTLHGKAALVLDQDENNDPIHYSFIDCDIVDSKPVIDEFCIIDSSALMNRKLSNSKAYPSAFGSILCSRYRKRSNVHVRHGFVSKHGVVPFRFNVPSPDDVILKHMGRFKR